MGAPVPSFYLFGRNENVARYLRDYRLRNPNADTRDGSEPWVRASALADTISPLYADALRVARSVSRITAQGSDLDDWAQRMGTVRAAATPASGFVVASTATAGATIAEGDVLTLGQRQYVCSVTALYKSGDLIPVAALDTGTSTNADAGSVLTWQAPRPGCAPTAVVAPDSDGNGLTGGRERETDTELALRLDYLAAHPPASGNDADYQRWVRLTPGVPVEQTFTWPALYGAGSNMVAATLRADVGASRIPSPAQVALMRAWTEGAMPADDATVFALLVEEPTTVKLSVTWASPAGWIDLAPWSWSDATVSEVTDEVTFAVHSATATSGPPVGATLALYDATSREFVRKQVKTVVSVGGAVGWRLTCETALGASNASYLPVVDQVVSPWADALSVLVQPLLAHFATLGPGEVLSVLPDPGLRGRRSPLPPLWPHVLTTKMLHDVYDLPQIVAASVTSPTLPYATPLGLAGVSANLLTLGDLGVYA